MIELNFLPQELRKKKKPATDVAKVPVIPIAIGAILALVTVHLSLFLMVALNANLASSLKNKWEELGPQRERTERINFELADVQKKVDAVRKLAAPSFSWAQLLGGLDQSVVPSVWLATLDLSSDKGGSKFTAGPGRPFAMDITGYALGSSAQATPTVAKFITSLKQNADFFEYFDEVELDNITNFQIAGEEAVSFKLECRFRPVAEPAVPEGAAANTAAAGK